MDISYLIGGLSVNTANKSKKSRKTPISHASSISNNERKWSQIGTYVALKPTRLNSSTCLNLIWCSRAREGRSCKCYSHSLPDESRVDGIRWAKGTDYIKKAQASLPVVRLQRWLCFTAYAEARVAQGAHNKWFKTGGTGMKTAMSAVVNYWEYKSSMKCVTS